MRISDEIDALEVMGIQPVTFLAATRLLGAWIALPFIYLVAIGVMYFASYIAVVDQVGDVSSGGYLLIFWMFQDPFDVIFSLTKGMVMATAIVVVGCYYGYTASGGPVGVGTATAQVDGRQHHPRPHHRDAGHGGLLGHQARGRRSAAELWRYWSSSARSPRRAPSPACGGGGTSPSPTRCRDAPPAAREIRRSPSPTASRH